MRHLIYISLFLITINFSYSQADLHVSSGSYVFVDGDGFTGATNAPLYVTANIDLANNGNIYLRDDAQLLQGSETARNSGLGTISIYQEGTVNKWAYNYWCSPVGNPTAAAINDNFSASVMTEVTGLISNQAFNFNPTNQYDGDDTTNPISVANRWFYTFTTSDEYSEWNFIGNASSASPGLGFTMKGTNATSGGFDPDTQGQRIDFRGKPNTGTIDIPVLPPVAGVFQWTLSGNPYPSALDAAAMLWDTENLGVDGIEGTADDITTGSIYFWDQDLASNSHNVDDYVGGYATLTTTGGGMISATAATWYDYLPDGSEGSGLPNPNMKLPTQFLTVGQGFMVEGNVMGNFKIKNSHRVFQKENAGTSIFYEANDAHQNTNQTTSNNQDANTDTQQTYFQVPEGYQRFRIFVEFNETYTRDLLHNFHSDATNGFDYGLEARSPEGVSSDAYWVLNNVPYVIQAHTFDENLRIPLVLNITENQPLNFKIADIQRFEASQPIFIHDTENNTYVNLREYDYDIILDAGEYVNRFEITFTEETLSNTVFNTDNFKVYQNNTASELTILNPNSLEITSVTLLDVTGKQIFKDLTGSNNQRLTFSTNTLSEGIYIATISIENTKTITEKVIVKNKR